MTNAKNHSSRPSNKKAGIVITAAALLIGASFGVQAIAESKPYQHIKLFYSNTDTNTDTANPFLQKASWSQSRKERPHGFSNMSDAEIEKRITRLVKHVAIEIDATSEQQQKITALVTAIAKDMKPLRQTFKDSREDIQELLLAPMIDRVALEKIRSERIADAEKTSKELVNTVADLAEILSLDQRKILDKRIRQFKSLRHRWSRG